MRGGAGGWLGARDAGLLSDASPAFTRGGRRLSLVLLLADHDERRDQRDEQDDEDPLIAFDELRKKHGLVLKVLRGTSSPHGASLAARAAGYRFGQREQIHNPVQTVGFAPAALHNPCFAGIRAAWSKITCRTL